MQKKEDSNGTLACTFLVVGGGIAGVSCAETLNTLCPNERTLLLTESSVVKMITNLEPLTRCIYKFDVQQKEIGVDSNLTSIITVVDSLQHIDTKSKTIRTAANRSISFRYICICTGGRPKLIENNNDRIIGIRDTDSMTYLQQLVQSSRKLVVVGNGGIASELVHEMKNIELHWIIKDDYISSTFIDPGAAEFFQRAMQSNDKATEGSSAIVKRFQYSEFSLPHSTESNSRYGPALGPDWQKNFTLVGSGSDTQRLPKIYYNAQVESAITSDNDEYPLAVTLNTGQCIDCDAVISATGVQPCMNFTCDQEFSLSDDNFIVVDELMRTSIKDVFAAGDVCSAGWEVANNWFQMRLWTQARQMGAMAGRSMVASLQETELTQDFCFELFGHCTTLFGFPVTLIGLFNGQGLGTDYEILLRTTPGLEYIKFVLQRGKLRGAILIGNEQLAETCENLILNGLDLTPFGDDLLNPDIDIEDYFD